MGTKCTFEEAFHFYVSFEAGSISRKEVQNDKLSLNTYASTHILRNLSDTGMRGKTQQIQAQLHSKSGGQSRLAPPLTFGGCAFPSTAHACARKPPGPASLVGTTDVRREAGCACAIAASATCAGPVTESTGSCVFSVGGICRAAWIGARRQRKAWQKALSRAAGVRGSVFFSCPLPSLDHPPAPHPESLLGTPSAPPFLK